jgi:hypothetical protein
MSNPSSNPYVLLLEGNDSYVPWSESCPVIEPRTRFTIGTGGCGGASVGEVSAVGCSGEYLQIHDWNQAQICNIINMMISTQVSIQTIVTQENKNDETNQIVINTTCENDSSAPGCDTFKLKNTDMIQTNVVSIEGVQMCYAANEVQEVLSLKLLQVSSGFTKGLHMNPQSSMSSNIMNMFFNVGTTINTNFSQICTANASNYIAINTSNYDTVSISDAIMKQSNDITLKCMQTTVETNTILQSIALNMSQLGITRNIGLTLQGLIICLIVIAFIFFACGSYITIFYAQKIALISMILFFLLGLFFILLFFLDQPKVPIWYGLSPGLGACSGTEQVDSASYESSDAAAKALLLRLDDGILGFDFSRNSSSSESGTATFYKGTISTDCYQMIINPSPSMWELSDLNVLIRNAIYISGTLADSQSVPNNSIEGDVFLNVLNGELFFRLPKNLSVGSGTSWQKPSVLSNTIKQDSSIVKVQMKDNVFTDASVSFSNGSKVFFYIPIGSTELRQNINDPNSKTMPIIGYSSDEPYGSTEPILYNNSSYTVKQIADLPSSKDFFLVPYPYGPTSIHTTNPPLTQIYMYGSVYYLYRAVQNTDSNTKSKIPYVPYNSMSEAQVTSILNEINGRGVIPSISWTNSTCIATPKRNYWYFWIGNCFFIFGIILFFIWLYQKQKAQEKQNGKQEEQKKLT